MQVLDSKSVEDLHSLLNSDEYDFRYDLGVATNVQSVQLGDKENIVMQLANHFTIFQCKAELDQILCGLSETLGLLDLVRGNPIIMRPLFVKATKPPLTAESLYDLFVMHYSKDGSNIKEREEVTGMRWFSFLECVEGIILHGPIVN